MSGAVLEQRILNQVTAAEGQAEAVGIQTMILPAPLPELPERDAMDSWACLYSDSFRRFLPEPTDLRVLRRNHSLKTKVFLQRAAPPRLREVEDGGTCILEVLFTYRPIGMRLSPPEEG